MIGHELVKLAAGVLGAVSAGLALVRLRVKGRDRDERIPAWNVVNAAVGTHDGVVTRKAQAAISTKHLLGKIGSSGEGFVGLTGVGDVPLYVMPDEAGAAGDAISCQVLGALGRTVRMVASDVIEAGAQVVPAANGKVRTLPTAAGTYQIVGRTLTAAGADGDLVEVVSCVARPVVVS